MKTLKPVSEGKGCAPIFENTSKETKESKSQNLILLPNQVEIKPKEKEPAKKVEVPPIKQPMQRLSIDQLTDKADKVYLLRKKYQEIRDKRKQLEGFTISHDGDNAQLTLVDANALTISTSNPVAIGKLLQDWMSDLNTHLDATEKEIREELEGMN